MQSNTLGATGVLVSELCLGTMTFGEGWGIGGINTAQATALIRRAIDVGINFIDTADVYGDGQSETILGQAVRGLRDQFVIATKAFGRMGRGANDSGLSRYHLVRACEASLHRLGTDRIDLYQIHGFDALTPMDETLEALDRLVQSGQVFCVGLWNPPARSKCPARGISRGRGVRRVVGAQVY